MGSNPGYLLKSYLLYYYGSNKSTGKETSKMHLCVLWGKIVLISMEHCFSKFSAFSLEFESFKTVFFFNLLLEVPFRYNSVKQSKYQLEKIIGMQKPTGKVRKDPGLPSRSSGQNLEQKSVNLRYITVGRLDDDMIVPSSDGAMFILID